MLDIGWSEFLVIGVVALIVIGPRELPGALRTAGRYAARARALAREFRDGLDDIARESELKDIEKQIVGEEDWRKDDWLEAKERPKVPVAAKADELDAESIADEAAAAQDPAPALAPVPAPAPAAEAAEPAAKEDKPA